MFCRGRRDERLQVNSQAEQPGVGLIRLGYRVTRHSLCVRSEGKAFQRLASILFWADTQIAHQAWLHFIVSNAAVDGIGRKQYATRLSNHACEDHMYRTQLNLRLITSHSEINTCVSYELPFELKRTQPWGATKSRRLLTYRRAS